MPFNSQALHEIVTDSGISYKENRISFIFNCPRCYKRDKLYIRKEDGRFICWFCADREGFRGKPEYALSELLAESYKSIKLKLYGDDIVEATVHWEPLIRDFFGDEDPIDEEAFEPVMVKWPIGFFPIDHHKSLMGAQYLAEERGIPIEIAMEYGVMFSPEFKRVYFPVEHNGILVGWQGRYVSHTMAYWHEKQERNVTITKILSSSGIPRSNCVMFSGRLRGSAHAILAEGPVDSIKAHLCGGNIATMGKVVTPEQINVIRNSGIHKIYMGLDPDAAEEVGKLIRSYEDIEFYNMRPPSDDIDLGKMSFEEVFDFFKSAPLMNKGHFYGYIRNHNN